MKSLVKKIFGDSDFSSKLFVVFLSFVLYLFAIGMLYELM